MLRVERLAGLPDEKVLRLHAVARAAIDGVLDAHRLRALPVEWALAQLKAVRGVGEWTAQHILLCGASLADVLPTAEPRVLRACGVAYGLGRAATLDGLPPPAPPRRGVRCGCGRASRSSRTSRATRRGTAQPRGRAPAPSQRAAIRRTAKHSGTTLTLAHIGG